MGRKSGNKHDKKLKRIFWSFDDIEEWGYEEEGFLGRNHPSIIQFHKAVYGCVGWMTTITESLLDEKKFNENIRNPIWRGHSRLTLIDGDKMLDSYIAGDIYGIKILNFMYWWQAASKDWETKWDGKSVFDYGEEEVKEMWEFCWRPAYGQERKDTHYGSDRIKDHLWNDENLLEESKTIIQRIAAITPQSVLDEVGKRKEKMQAVIDGKAEYVCDDIWKKLDTKSIHDAYEKEFIGD